jgi:hypothetical protein
MADRLRRLMTAAALVLPAGAVLSGTTVESAAAAAGQAVAAPVPEPAVLQGASPVIRWRNVDDAEVVRVVVRRAQGTVAPATPLDGASVYDGAPGPDGALQLVTDTVAAGGTYSYGFWSVDSGGGVSAEATRSLVADGVPVLTVPRLGSDAGAVTRFRLSWAATRQAPGQQYTVKWATRSPATGPVGPPTIWRLDTSATSATFGGNGSPFVPRAGATYHLEVLSQDPYGNDTRHAVATVVEPYDTTVATASKGWRTLHSSRRWGGTVAVASTAGAAMTFHVVGSAVTVVADRCPGCGRLLVSVDGHTRAVADTHARKLAVRQEVATVSWLGLRRHTVTVRVVGTAGHPAVQLDGLASVD